MCRRLKKRHRLEFRYPKAFPLKPGPSRGKFPNIDNAMNDREATDAQNKKPRSSKSQAVKSSDFINRL